MVAYYTENNATGKRATACERRPGFSGHERHPVEKVNDPAVAERLIALTGDYCAIDAVSGHEHALVRRLEADLRDHVDDLEIDPFGNLVATLRGPEGTPSLMIAAHSDEIGAIVKAIEPDGMIRFERVGGVVETLLVGRAVRVRGLPGVIGAKAGHITPPAERLIAPALRDLYLDLGCDDSEAVAALGVRVGDAIAYDAPLRRLANPDRISGKAIDNRIGCAVVVELAQRLRDREPQATIHLVITTQEEVGLRGAEIVTYRLDPTAAIVIDTMPCGGTPDVSATRDLPVTIGAGPVITLSSQGASRGAIAQPAMTAHLVRHARALGRPWQRGLFQGGNSDAAAVHLVRAGVPTGIVNLARRYSHSPVEVLDIHDAVGALDLIEAFAREFSAETDLSFFAADTMTSA